jgi:hypothetical protein
MKELVFALQFKGKARPVEGVEGQACRQDDRGRPGPAHRTNSKGRPGQGGIETGPSGHL